MNCEAIAVPRRMLAIPRLKLPFMKPWRKWNKPRVVGDMSGNLQLKNKSQATGSTSNPTTTSTTYAVTPEMTLTVTTKGNKVLLLFSCWVLSGTADVVAAGYFAFFRDGTQISQDFFQNMWGTTTGVGFTDERTVTMQYLDTPSAGSHTYDVRWKNSVAGTPAFQAFGTSRQFQLTELG